MDVVDERKQSMGERLKNIPVIKRLCGIKNIRIVVIIFIIAISLIIYSSIATTKQSVGKVVNTSASEQELKLSAILSNIDGAGRVETMITHDGNKIVGVLIIADGAVNPLVRIKLVEATSVALGVDSKIVSVFAKQSGQK